MGLQRRDALLLKLSGWLLQVWIECRPAASVVLSIACWVAKAVPGMRFPRACKIAASLTLHIFEDILSPTAVFSYLMAYAWPIYRWACASPKALSIHVQANAISQVLFSHQSIPFEPRCDWKKLMPGLFEAVLFV